MNQLVEQTIERLIANIETAGEWFKTWTGGGLPRNYTTKARYHGVNILLLWAAQTEHGYQTAEWATYKQWQAMGYQVRQGEKSTVILIVKDALGKEKEDGEREHYKMFKCAFVFNADQLIVKPDGLIAEKKVMTEEERHRLCAELLATTGASIMTKADRASYNKSIDVIGMPPIDSFISLDAYYATAFHELIHWTGHPSRLDRVMGKPGKDYAFEELVAEMGAAFLNTEFGIAEFDTHDNSAAYLKTWLDFFKDDKAGALMRAASAASKAHEFIREMALSKEIAA